MAVVVRRTKAGARLAVILNSDSCSDQFLAGGATTEWQETLGLNAAREKDRMGFDGTDIQ
jgi:hypothetical protein